jgi:hypothetical protein
MDRGLLTRAALTSSHAQHSVLGKPWGPQHRYSCNACHGARCPALTLAATLLCPQTINCLELWAKVLAAHSGDHPDLRALVYPVAQLLLGAARLVPTPAYFPLRLRWGLGAGTAVFVLCVGGYSEVASCMPAALALLDWVFGTATLGPLQSPHVFLALPRPTVGVESECTGGCLCQRRAARGRRRAVQAGLRIRICTT